jgi:prophage antirepressor-like protein
MTYLKKFAKIKGIQIIEQDGLNFYNGQQVCQLLGFANNRDAISRHTLPRERTVIEIQGKRGVVFVDDSGFLALAFVSKFMSDEIKGTIRDELLQAFTQLSVFPTGKMAKSL